MNSNEWTLNDGPLDNGLWEYRRAGILLGFASGPERAWNATELYRPTCMSAGSYVPVATIPLPLDEAKARVEKWVDENMGRAIAHIDAERPNYAGPVRLGWDLT